MKQAFTSIYSGALFELGAGTVCLPAQIQSGAAIGSKSLELTQTESFPVKLSWRKPTISSHPDRAAWRRCLPIWQALEDIGAASLICGVSSDAPKDATSGAKVCGNRTGAGAGAADCGKSGLGAGFLSDAESQIASLEEQGITVLTFSRPKTLDEIQARYRQLFTLCYGLDGSAKATTFLTSYQSKLLDAIQPAADYAKLTGRKSAVYLAQLDYTMATGEVFEGKLLDQMGLNNLGELGSRCYPRLKGRAKAGHPVL